MTGICGHIPGTTCSNCVRSASIAPWQAQRRDHYALTSDRYAANEARQWEEAEPAVTPSTDATVSQSEPDPIDDASIEEVLAFAAKASRRWARTLELLKQAEEEEQQREDAPDPDPLDEDDHRDRVDRHGDIWVRHGHEHWHFPDDGYDEPCPDPALCDISLRSLDAEYGPLTFASDDFLTSAVKAESQASHDAKVNIAQTAAQTAALVSIAISLNKIAEVESR